MPISDEVIRGAVARYDRERDRYLKLAARVADICRAHIVEGNAIRAQITSRTKTVRSFESKLRRFAKRSDKKFVTVDDVFKGIGDFAGVRVATYRPEDEPYVADAIKKIFTGAEGAEVDVDLKDKLKPASAQFYRATHCQVFLPDDELGGDNGNLRGASCEVQICSMMAHVWNEIEHDIGYKPEGGGPGQAERGLLEVLGHLTRSGDATITQLLAANYARMTAQTGDFGDVHDFVARLRGYFPEADLSVNAGPAFDEAMSLGLTSVERFKNALGNDSLSPKIATDKIDRFNAFLVETGRSELTLNRGSADLILISILHHRLEQVVENHSASDGKARPSRVQSILRSFQDYRQVDATNKTVA